MLRGEIMSIDHDGPQQSTAPAVEPEIEASAPAEAAEPEAAAVEPEKELPAKGKSGEPVVELPDPVFSPNTKFKASVYNKESKQLDQKEYDIDPKFHALMKTPEDEKLVRELHEKAFGIDSVKERLNETKGQAQKFETDLNEYKTTVSGLQKIYKTAVETGNYHKLDGFFQKLNIPQEVVMQYALEKVRLSEMPEAQRNAIMGQLQAETRAETVAEQQDRLNRQMNDAAVQMKTMQFEAHLSRPEISTLAQQFDTKVGRAGAFRHEVAKVGELAWYQSGGKIDLTPEQAAQQVIQNYGLMAQAQPAAAKPIVPLQRTTKTIPNVAGRSSSPLGTKPKSIEDLQKIYKDMA